MSGVLRRRWNELRGADAAVPAEIPDRATIFVTVGTELPFDRLVRAVDDWAGQTGRAADVFAQIGRTEYVPANIGWTPMIEGPAFRRLFDGADLVVAHAGMGTILAALEVQQPLIVVPRRAALGEHRNDHQLATVERLSRLGLVHVAADEAELVERLDEDRPLTPCGPLESGASGALIAAIRTVIEDGWPS